MVCFFERLYRDKRARRFDRRYPAVLRDRRVGEYCKRFAVYVGRVLPRTSDELGVLTREQRTAEVL